MQCVVSTKNSFFYCGSFILIETQKERGFFVVSEYAIFRVAKLKQGHGKQSIGRCIRHLEKHTETADISRPDRLEMNQTKKYVEDYRKEIKKSIERHNQVANRALRKDASVALEMVFTFSPEVEKNINPNDFYKCIKQFYNECFADCQILRVDFHASESVNHFHLVTIPITKDGKISAKEYLGNKEHLSRLQDRFAEICSCIGLKRGKSYVGQKEKPHHLSLKRYKAQQEHEIKQLQQLKKKVQTELQQELCR